MQMTNIRVANLTGTALAWASAKSLDFHIELAEFPRVVVERHDLVGSPHMEFLPTKDWALAGPIIERERICLRDTGEEGDAMWEADDQREAGVTFRGATPLEAAMRAFVAGVAGSDIDVPTALVGV